MATIAVVVLASSILAIISVVMLAAENYVDNVYRYESRLEARQNLSSCLNLAELMLSRDFFLRGQVSLPEFYCVASFVDVSGGDAGGNAPSVLLSVAVSVGPAIMRAEEVIYLEDFDIKVVSRKVTD